ncbi:MAG: putative membrane protein [Candidatus Nanosalina sp. J07AB43]|nr:MAG: putative membrane protein [Candidatus Nanosalina sp. J07AB43]
MKLAKASILYRALRSSASFGAIFILSSSIQEVNLIAVLSIIVGTGLIIGVNLVWQYLIWRNYNLNLEENNLKITKGVLSKEDRKIPFDRIQNVDIKRNIVHRLMGISRLNVETAGGNKTEASIKHLRSGDATQLRNRLSEGKTTKISENSQTQPEYQIGKKELALLSATSVDGRFIAAVGTLSGIAPSIIESTIEEISLDPTAGSALLLIGGLGATWVLGAVSTFLRYWKFKLYENEDSLRYERGLINRAEGEIPLQKIQKLTVEENLPQRILGYATLKIDTAGYSPTQSATKGPEAAIPLAKQKKIEKISKKVADTTKTHPQGITAKARRRYVFRYCLASLIGSLLVYYFTNSLALTAALTTALTAVSVAAGHLKWKNIGYSINEKHVVTSKGFWNHRTSYIPYFRVQNLIETRSILQKRWGVSTLDIDTAGTGNILNRTHIPDLNKVKARELRQEIFRRFQDSLQQAQSKKKQP